MCISCLPLDRSLFPILQGLHVTPCMGCCRVDARQGSRCGQRGGCHSCPCALHRPLGASSAWGPAVPSWPLLLLGHTPRLQPPPSHRLRAQAGARSHHQGAGVRSVLGTQPGSEGRPCWPLCPDAGHGLQGVPGDKSLPLGIVGGGFWALPTPPQFPFEGLDKEEAPLPLSPQLPAPNVNHISFMAFSFSEKHIV